MKHNKNNWMFVPVFVMALALINGCTSVEVNDQYSDYSQGIDNDSDFIDYSQNSPAYNAFIETQRTDGVYHTVKKGETLWRISQMYNVDMNEILSSNPHITSSTNIEKNTSVFIPGATQKSEVYRSNDKDDSTFIWPVKGKIIGEFKERRAGKINNGIDIQTLQGELVYASSGGKVIFADYLSGYGKTVMIDHGNQLISVYSQNSELLVRVDENVRKRHAIARVGKASSVAYLHFEIRKNSVETNPMLYLKQ